MNQFNLTAASQLLGRVLMATIFIVAAYGKISAYAGTQAYMESMGVSGALLPLVIALELGGGLALLFGFQARIAALLLAVFSIVSALIFHANLADQTQQIMFLKNLAMAGGLLYVTASGAGVFAVGRKA